MFIEDLLLPLQRDGNDWLDKSEAIEVLESLYSSIEHRPLSARERRLLKTTVIDFLQLTNIRGDVNIEAKFAKRFSYDYLPIMSNITNKVESTSSNAINNNINEDNKNHETIPDLAENTSSGHAISSLIDISNSTSIALLPVPSGFYYICSIIRQRSTLSTTYRMNLENKIDLSSNDKLNLSNNSSNSLLGSRISKGGMIQGCSVWSINDSKLWKDKNSIAKICKTNNIYNLKLQLNNINIENEENKDDYGIIGVIIRNKTIDKLINITSIISYKNIDENIILNHLNTYQKSLSNSNNLSNEFLLMKSRLPNKTISEGKEINAVDFGSYSRIKIPSRKNVVLDEIEYNNDYQNDWNTAVDKPPLFQLGKVEEDIFALDFHGMSPLQAFTLALAILDQ